MNHESFKDQAAQGVENRNWLAKEDAEKISQKILDEHPDAQIEVTKEHFVVTHRDGSATFVPRWRKIPFSEDGKSQAEAVDVEDRLKDLVAQ